MASLILHLLKVRGIDIIQALCLHAQPEQPASRRDDCLGSFGADVLGGLHLLKASPERIEKTIAAFRRFDP